MMKFSALITHCKKCGESNRIPCGKFFYIDVEEGVTSRCEWCGSKNISVEYEKLDELVRKSQRRIKE